MLLSRKTLGLVTIMTLAGSGSLAAETSLDRITERAAGFVGQVRVLIQGLSPAQGEQQRQAGPPPGAIPTGGSIIDLRDLSQPTLVESRIQSALSSAGN